MSVLRVLLVHGGNSHPLQLVQSNKSQNRRAEFLKSRPRFDASYFDGQRDPAEGWMSAWNAWRYPTFCTGHSASMTIFTFQPPNTLYIDAALQAQNDADLIEAGDRTNYEHIIDAVTHQPLGRQAALKGVDGIFYWDLSAKPKAEGQRPSHGLLPLSLFPPKEHACFSSAQSSVWFRARRTRRATCVLCTTSGGRGCRRVT